GATMPTRRAPVNLRRDQIEESRMAMKADAAAMVAARRVVWPSAKSKQPLQSRLTQTVPESKQFSAPLIRGLRPGSRAT
ncbi:MAG TPA: hypothetical protein VFK49_00455, partial [Stellaceae bacterium]|nr:hypothetical protein [Stellaceae bacterium]